MKLKKIATSIILISLLSNVACDDNIDKLVEKIDTDRQFTPAQITTENGQTQVVIKWRPSLSGGNLSYTLEVAKDINFTDVKYTITTTATQVVVTNDDIEIKQNHYARVKTIGSADAEDSKWIVSSAFQIIGEQIFLQVQEVDLTNNSVNLKWGVGGNVTHIVVTPESGSPLNFDITTDEQTAQAKLITGLTPGTGYVAEIFNGETSRGTVSFITFSIEVPEAELIVYLGADDIFAQETFDTLTVTSVTFVLLQASVYGSNTGLTLKGNTDITFFGEPGANKPIMAFNGFTLPGVGGKIKFENVDLTGFEYANGSPTSTKRAYIFNQSAATQTSEIVFENCVIRNFENTPVRIQGSNAIDITNLKVNNSIVYDISTGGQNYAFINNTATNGRLNNIEITNSTFYHLKIGLILHNTTPSQSLTITSCTVDDISIDGRALVDYNTQTVTAFTFTANVLGKTKGVTTVRGIRIASASVSVPSSNYITTDYVTVNNPIGGVTTYAGTSTDLFESPATGNFNFKDTNFAGKSTAGDPRWQ